MLFFLYLRVIVKKKLKKGPKLEELEERGEEEREGRHLLLMQGFPVYQHPTFHDPSSLPDIFLQLQCLTPGCSSQPSRATFCCVHNVNIECCAFRNFYSAVDDWRPMLEGPGSDIILNVL